MFFILNDVDTVGYAEDNTLYAIADDIKGFFRNYIKIAFSEKNSKALFVWFANNLLKSDADKCNLLVSSSGTISIRLFEYDIKNSECEKLLGVKLSISQHLKHISLILVEKLGGKLMQGQESLFASTYLKDAWL